jgi:hypothetical protein
MRSLIVLLLFSVFGCAPVHRPAAIDPDLAACVPAGASAIAGIDVARLRGTAIYEKLPVRDASYVLAASDGKDWLLLGRGELAGGTSIASGITAIGSGELVKAAAAQHRTGKTGAADLLARAAETPIWLVARGNMSLPVSGNLANINRLLRQTEYMTVAARVNDRLEVEAAGSCRSPEQARHLEENVRALASLLLAKYPVQVQSDGATVRVTASLPMSLVSP